MAKKMTNRQKQAIQTKNKIFKAAVSIMQKQSVEETTIEQICKKANVSIGSFYNYFKSKYDVIYEVYHSADVYFEEVVQPLVKNLDYKDKILTFFRHYALYNISTGLDFAKSLYGAFDNKFFIAPNRFMHELLHSIIIEAQDAGRIKSNISALEIEDFMFVIARGVVSDWCVNDGKYDLEMKMIFFFEKIMPLYIS